MEIARTIKEAVKAVGALRHPRKVVGLVPTMGALHEGHLSLVRAARLDCDVVVVSIFVNPTQFGPSEDFDRYPRDFDSDAALLEKEDVGLVFTTTAQEMYPAGYSTFVLQGDLAGRLCGKSRPTHFRGVLTVVLKLFNILNPALAYFGQKDAQQVLMIKRMVADLNLSVEVRTLPTMREKDGLAMSSRNRRLSPEERKQGVCLYEALCAARDALAGGERNTARLIRIMRKKISTAKLAEIDYVDAVYPETLRRQDAVGKCVLLALAVRFGSVRLIDNMCLISDGTETLC